MNKIRNHAIGASITAITLAAVVLTGCAETPAECEDYDAASMSFVDKVGGTSGGGSRGGSVSRPVAPAPKPNLNKPAAPKPGAGSGGSSSTDGGKAKAPKVKIDTDDCEVSE